jgi:hypothetical protein
MQGGSMKTYAVKTMFSFIGKFFIKAESEKEAREWIEHCCVLVMGRGIHTSLHDECVNWEFPIHAHKTILNINKEGGNDAFSSHSADSGGQS